MQGVDADDWARRTLETPGLSPEARLVVPIIARVAARNGGAFTAEDIVAEIFTDDGGEA